MSCDVDQALKRLRGAFFALVLLSFFLAATVASAASKTPAQILYEQVASHLDSGMVLEGCKLARGFNKFTEDPFYPKAEAGLLEYGISIERPLYSYSMRRIIDLQNREEARRLRTGNTPKAGPRANFRDAWGTPIRVELVARKGFLYILRSAGGDKKFFTTDDMVVGVRQDDDAAPSPVVEIDPKGPVRKDLHETTAKSGRRSLFGSQMRPQAPAASNLPSGSTKGKPVKNGEVEVSLDELLDK